jgi:hypothetical protein
MLLRYIQKDINVRLLLFDMTFAVDNDDKEGWYQRDDRNYWRPVTEKLFYEINEKESETFSRSEAVRKRMKDRKEEEVEKPIFHHSRLQRKSDVMAQRKKRKLEWMKRTYMQGKKQQEPTEENVDELLDWCATLDYDKYVKDWLSLATTLGSDYMLPKQAESRHLIYEQIIDNMSNDDSLNNTQIMNQHYETPTPEMDPNYRFMMPDQSVDVPVRKAYSAYSLAVDEILSGEIGAVAEFEKEKQEVMEMLAKRRT